MNALDVLKALRVVNASLRRDGDGLVLSSPRGAVSPELAEEIRNNRTELLDLLEMADVSVGESVSNETRARPEDLPLGLTQQRFWYLASMTPESAIYNLPAAFRLSGELDVAVLEKAINRIIARHEILRTRIAVHNYEAVQEIEPEIAFRLDQVDLSTFDPGAAMDELIRQIDIARGKPIPMDQAPMLKAALYRLGLKDHVLFWMPHHVIWDGWSFDIFLKELQHIYGALEAGAEPVLAPLPLQYVDYALWHRQLAEGDKLAQHMEFWSTQLSGELPVLELATDRPRPDMMSFEGVRAVLDIDGDIIARLTQIGREEGATLFMVLLAGFYAFLYRYTGQDDLIVGSPVQSRIDEDADNIIGVFVNTLVLRTQLSPSLSFRKLIGQVKALCVSAYDHQDTPFEVLVEEFETERTLSRNPLYQVLFSYQDVTNRDATLGTLDLEQLHIETSVAPTDLTVWLMETGDGLIGGIDYAAELFDRTTVERMIAHYSQLLAAGADNPLATIGALPLLSEAERQRLLVEWNNTETTYSPNETLASLFEGQVRRSPDRVALVFEDQELTYMELNRRANQLAHHLQKFGVGPDVVVGVFMERSIEMVVSLYATIKAGGAYLPVDPEYPAERIAFMLEDSRPAIVLTQDELRSKLTHTQRVLILDGDRTFLADEPASNPEQTACPENLAYVIYTSGSTGQPKGVMNDHQGIVNRLQWMQDAYPLDESDCVLQKTPFSFDVSVWEFFWPLQVGARLVVACPGGHRDNTYLVDLICAQGITVLHFVPSMLQLWIEERGLSECSSLRRVFCSGEALPYELQQRFFERVDADLENLYGPTEAAVDVTYWHCERDSSLKIVPIGRPVANTQIYILDRNLEPVPEGVTGELHIGGVQVARDYLNRPELSEEKFIPDPFSNHSNARLYKTGDMARYLMDGTIQYLGRVDHQVKIRGFRVEPGEIEAALLCLPEVCEAAATTQKTEAGDARVVAYVVFAADEELTTTEFRKALGKTLPAYMIPSVFTELNSMPRTPNGKVDRNSLSFSTQSAIGSGQAFKAAESDQEIMVADVWQELLDIDKISMNDNFFDLGGFSLLSMRCIAQIEELTGVTINPRELFFKSAGELALFLQEQLKAKRNLRSHPYL